VIAPHEAVFNFLRTLHDVINDALFAVASLRVIAVFKHHFWYKDDVLVRMLPIFDRNTNYEKLRTVSAGSQTPYGFRSRSY